VADDLAAAVERVCDEAVAVLSDLAAGTSMCAIARSGRSFPAAKYHEGRLAAGTAVRRALRDHPDADAALARAREQWTRTSPRLLRSSADGRAYGAGGDDALTELAESAGLVGDGSAG
jgi:hypothetical protein